MNLSLATQLPAEPTAVEQRRLSGGMVPGGRVRLLRLIGPAFVAAVAFIDPGNFATNITAGADYGYLLLWAVLSASVMATLVQYLSAKLGAATGGSLASVCREHTSTPVRIGLWLVAEGVVIMTDLAEFVGGAVALNLLFGMSPLTGGLIIAAATMVILRTADAWPGRVSHRGRRAAVRGDTGVRLSDDPQFVQCRRGGLRTGAAFRRAGRACCSPAGSSARP